MHSLINWTLRVVINLHLRQKIWVQTKKNSYFVRNLNNSLNKCLLKLVLDNGVPHWICQKKLFELEISRYISLYLLTCAQWQRILIVTWVVLFVYLRLLRSISFLLYIQVNKQILKRMILLNFFKFKSYD